jgi:NitT/TauT family transport system substrate-binding protein
MRHRQIGCAALAIAILATVACGGGATTTKTSSGQTLEVIKGAFFPGTFPNLPEAVALDQGFFTKHGVQYDPVTIEGGGAQQGAALAGGSIDIAPQEVRAMILADIGGASFQLVAGSFRKPIYTIVVRNSWPTPHLGQPYPAPMQDLKGAKMGITSLGSGTDFFLSLLLKGANLPDDYFSRIPVGTNPLQVLAAFKAGSIDGYMAFEPATQLLLANGGKGVLDTTKGEGPLVVQKYMYNGYATTAANVKNRPDALKRFVAAMIDSERFINNPANNAAVKKAFIGQTTVGAGIPDEVLNKAILAAQPLYNPLFDQAGYDLQVKMLQDFNFIKPGQTAPAYSTVIATSIAPTKY